MNRVSAKLSYLLKVVQLLNVGARSWIWIWAAGFLVCCIGRGVSKGDWKGLGGYWDSGRLIRGTHDTDFILGDLWVKGRSSGPAVLGMGSVGGGWPYIFVVFWILKVPALSTIPCCQFSLPILSSLASVNWWILGCPSASQDTPSQYLLSFQPLLRVFAGLSSLHSALSPWVISWASIYP